MIQAVVGFFDRKMGIYSAPQLDNHQPEVLAEMYGRAYRAGQLKDAPGLCYADLELVLFGTFDDKTGIITAQKPITLLVFSTIEKVEVKVNEQESM